jgi:hypothetical protein
MVPFNRQAGLRLAKPQPIPSYGRKDGKTYLWEGWTVWMWVTWAFQSSAVSPSCLYYQHHCEEQVLFGSCVMASLLACAVQKYTEWTTSKLLSCIMIFLRWQVKTAKIWCLVGPAADKKNTDFRDSVNMTERLAITLGFPATVDSYHSTMYLFKVSAQSVSLIIPRVC